MTSEQEAICVKKLTSIEWNGIEEQLGANEVLIILLEGVRKFIYTAMSEVQRVKLSRRSCMINVLSLYDSSPNVSSSEIASSKA